MQGKKRKIASVAPGQRTACASLAVCGGLFLLLNAITPLAADDYYYACRLTVGADGTLQPVGRLTGPGDIFASLKSIALAHSGRLPVLGAAQLFTLWPKAVFNFCSTVVFLLLLCVLVRLACPRTPRAAVLCIPAVCLLLWVFTPAFGQDFLWQNGALNYLWTNTVNFGFLLPYLQAEPLQMGDRRRAALWFCLGLFSGWSMENQAAAACFLCVARLAAERFRKQPIPRWLLAGAAGQLIGFALLLAAPGSYRRSAGYGQGGLPWQLLPARLSAYTAALWRELYGLIVPTLALSILLWIVGTPAQRRYLARLLGGAALCHAVMVVVPVYPMRAMLGTELYLVAALLYCLNRLPHLGARAVCALGLAMLVSFANTLPGAVGDLRAFDDLTAARGAFILTQRAAGETEVTVPIAHAKTKFNPLWGDALSDLMQNPTNERNVALAYYYGVASVRGIPQ